MRPSKFSALVAVMLTAACLRAAAEPVPDKADPVADFYRGKQVRFIISTAVGGDYDQWSRLIVRFLGQHVPGHPQFIPQNMPGGGQLTATNYLFNVAPSDGSVIGMIGRNLPNDALIKKPGVRFDPMKFEWLGSPELPHRVCTAMKGAPVQTAADLFHHELLMGGAGAGTAVSTMPTLLANLLGLKFRLVEGYGSSQAVLLAMERGEVQGICQTLTSLRSSRPEWIETGKLKVLFNTERNRVPGLDAPSVFEFARTEEQRKVLGLYASSVEIGRPIVAPPGVPQDRIAALRKALGQTLADPALREEAGKAKLDINFVPGTELAQFVAELMATPADVVEKMKILSK